MFTVIMLYLYIKVLENEESFFHDASNGTLPEEAGVSWFKEKILTVL